MDKKIEQKVKDFVEIMERNISPETLEIIENYTNNNDDEKKQEYLVYNSIGTVYAKL